MRRTLLACMLASLIAGTGHALGPHEVLLLINTNSPDSVAAGEEFARLRHIPEVNVVRLSLSPEVWPPANTISREDFTSRIWIPATNEVARRGIGDHVLAWVYSAGFPTRVSSPGLPSITGLTLLRNRAPQAGEVDQATYVSPLFAGPDTLGAAAHAPQSFDVLAAWLGDEMPLPSMMLGVTAMEGSSLSAVMNCISNGILADGSCPTGTVYFVTNSDVRSQCRSWQFAGAREELAGAGVAGVVTAEMPKDANGILGVMSGYTTVTPSRCGRFLPGCIAEHLTSLAGDFDDKSQTKLTAWIDAGATASAGTVSEPMAKWRKFPNARVFAHYASGCTVIESLFQSVRSPLQILFVGDPLCRPWADKATMRLRGMPGGDVRGTFTVAAEVNSPREKVYPTLVVLVDGKTVARQWTDSCAVDTTRLSDGIHTLRLVAYGAGPVREQVFAEAAFTVRNR